MRLIPMFALLASMLTACVTTTTNDSATATASKTPTRDIKLLTFISGGPPLPAQLRRNKSLTIGSDLNAKAQTKNGYNAVLDEKSGKISRSQFNSIVAKLNAANYIYLKPTQKQPVPGSGNRTLVINSDLGAHRFVDGSGSGFPAVIAEIFAMKAQLSP